MHSRIWLLLKELSQANGVAKGHVLGGLEQKEQQSTELPSNLKR